MCAAVPTRSDFIIAFQLGLMVKRTLSAFWTVALSKPRYALAGLAPYG